MSPRSRPFHCGPTCSVSMLPLNVRQPAVVVVQPECLHGLSSNPASYCSRHPGATLLLLRI